MENRNCLPPCPTLKGLWSVCGTSSWVLLLIPACSICTYCGLLPFHPCEEFYCKCWFVGETARASMLSWKLYTPTSKAVIFYSIWVTTWGLRFYFMNFLQISFHWGGGVYVKHGPSEKARRWQIYWQQYNPVQCCSLDFLACLRS